MGRSKKQTTDTENLQKQVKELKSINRHLERELKKSKQSKAKSKEHQDALIEEEYKEKNKLETCPQCEKGNISETALGVRTIISCSNGCGYRQVIKHGKKEKSEEV